MFDWIAGFVASWAGRVAAPILDLVHQVVHAAVGWLLGIIRGVQNALSFTQGVANWLIGRVESVARDIGNWISYLTRTVLPFIYGRIEAAFNYAVELWRDARNYAFAGLNRLESITRSLITQVYRWAYDNIWLPLKRYADAIYDKLIQWGFTAWDLVTHPDKLAAILLAALIRYAESVFWQIAAPVGTFALRIVVANTRRFAALLETILTAVI